MKLEIHPVNPQPTKIKKVVDVLNADGVIIYPTDTIYAFGCSSNSKKGFEQLCKIKHIDPEKAHFSLICADISQASKYIKNLSDQYFKLIKRALPGPYTFIFEAGSELPKGFLNRKKQIGIRIPENAITQAIVKELGIPLLSTSVHDEDEIVEYTTDPDVLEQRFGKIVDVIIDGGFGKNKPSTVIDCTQDQPVIIREGLWNIDAIL